MKMFYAQKELLRSPDDPTATSTTTPPPSEPSTTQVSSPDTTVPNAAAAPPPESLFGIQPVEITFVEKLVPEGFTLDKEAMSKFIEATNGAKSREEFVASAINQFLEHQQKAENAIVEQWNSTQDAWKKELADDPKIGGQFLEKNLASVKETISTYSDNAAAVLELMNLTGLGNNRHFVQLLTSLAAAVPTEGKPVQGNPGAVDKSRADRLFTTT